MEDCLCRFYDRDDGVLSGDVAAVAVHGHGRSLIADYFRMPLKPSMANGDKTSLSDSVIPGGGMTFSKSGRVGCLKDKLPVSISTSA